MNRAPTMERCRKRICFGLLASAGTLMLGCSSSDADPATDAANPRGAEAVWTIETDGRVGPDTDTFRALVQRVGCHNGVTGEVREPDVEFAEGEVVVTFYVEPDQGTFNCLGNNDVPYEVTLAEPLGDRRLVDGQCGGETDASSTTHCEPDGVRYRPSNAS